MELGINFTNVTTLLRIGSKCSSLSTSARLHSRLRSSISANRYLSSTVIDTIVSFVHLGTQFIRFPAKSVRSMSVDNAGFNCRLGSYARILNPSAFCSFWRKPCSHSFRESPIWIINSVGNLREEICQVFWFIWASDMRIFLHLLSLFISQILERQPYPAFNTLILHSPHLFWFEGRRNLTSKFDPVLEGSGRILAKVSRHSVRKCK